METAFAYLRQNGIPWAIPTSGRMETARINIEALGVDPSQMPVVARDQVKYAKPDPDLFATAAARLNTPVETTVVVGDAIWGMLAARRARLRCGVAIGRLRPGGAGAGRGLRASIRTRRTYCTNSTRSGAGGESPLASVSLTCRWAAQCLRRGGWLPAIAA